MQMPPLIAGAGETIMFPRCEADGPKVDAEAYVEPKTGLAVAVCSIVLGLGILIAVITIWLAIIILIGMLFDYFRQRKALAIIKGSAIEINEAQFPEIHACANAVARRLGLQETPLVYLVEGNTINASAMRLAGRRLVLLQDDLVYACLVSGEPRTLSFFVAHELAHHALGHTGYFRSQLSRMMKWLSRLDEFSCDAVGNQIAGNPAISAKALTVLLSGPQMLPYVNAAKLVEQARQVEADKKSKKAQRRLTHPLLLLRLLRFVN